MAVRSALNNGRALLPRNIFWYSFLLEAESTTGPYCSWKDYVINDIETRTRDIPACRIVPQQTMLPIVPFEILAAKCKVVPVLKELSTTPLRRKAVWIYRPTYP
jgi:hypothetical protein